MAEGCGEKSKITRRRMTKQIASDFEVDCDAVNRILQEQLNQNRRSATVRMDGAGHRGGRRQLRH